MIRPSFMLHASLFVFLAALLLQGCQSYTIVQRNMFTDDDGNVVVVEYGRSEKDHVNTFVAPGTGREVESKSKLMVRVRFDENVRDYLEVLGRGSVTNRIELADQTFTAWQCMNFLPRGTMYRTDNDKWMLLANGLSCTIFRQTKEDKKNYLEVFRGVLCKIDDSCKVKKDERWKAVPKGAGR